MTLIGHTGRTANIFNTQRKFSNKTGYKAFNAKDAKLNAESFYKKPAELNFDITQLKKGS